MWERMEAFVETGNILRYKVGRSLLRNYFGVDIFISQSYTILVMEQNVTLSLWNLRRDILNHNEAYDDKGVSLRRDSLDPNEAYGAKKISSDNI